MSVTNFYLILSNCIYQQSVRPVTFFYILFPKKCPALNTAFRLLHSYAEISNIFCEINYDSQNCWSEFPSIQLNQSQRDSRAYYKKAVLKSFKNFTGKNFCMSLFSNKVSGL